MFAGETLDKVANGIAWVVLVIVPIMIPTAKALGIESVAFDRAGFRFHGRVKALADAAREGGLKF